MRAVSNKYLTMPFCLAGLTAGLLAISLSGCGKEGQNTIESELPGPGGAYRAVIFHRKPDAFRTETENISIVRCGDVVLNDIGNVYCASREATTAPQKLWLNWRTPSNLQIFRDPKTRSYKEEKHFECLTGIFIQTTGFDIEYGDYSNLRLTSDPEPKSVKSAVQKSSPAKLPRKSGRK